MTTTEPLFPAFPPPPSSEQPTAPIPPPPQGPVPPPPPPRVPAPLPLPPHVPRRRRAWHRVAAAFAALLALATVGYGCLSLVDVAARKTTRTTRVVAAAPIIRLDLSGGSVTITGEDRSDIRIDRKVRQGLRDVHASEQREGDALVLDSNCPIFLGNLCEVDYTLRVPKGTDVIGHTGGGHMNLDDLGRIDVSSGGGGISIERARGPVSAHTGGGSIDGRGLRGVRFEGRSGGGSIDVRFDVAPTTVDVHTGGGHVRVVVPLEAPPYNVDAHTGGGGTSIEIPTDPAAHRVITARSGGGSIEVRHPQPGD